MGTPDGEDLRRQPEFSIQDAELFLQNHYGLAGEVSQLPSERDQNFRIRAKGGSMGEQYVLKIANLDTTIETLELENQAMRLAEAVPQFNSPQLIKSLGRQTLLQLNNRAGSPFFVRCLRFVPGTPLAELASPANELRERIGFSLANLDLALSALNQNLSAKRDLKWDLVHAPAIVQKTIPHITDHTQRALLECVLALYNEIRARVARLPKSVIHNDANDYNIIIDQNCDPPRVGLIDFGDIVYSTTINDLAICLAYVILDDPDPLAIASHVISGYNHVRRLTEQELSVLFPLLCLRLAQSVCIASEQKLVRPENEYLSISERPAWLMLQRLAKIAPERARMEFTTACQKTMFPTNQGRIEIDHPGCLDSNQILALRNELLNPALSLSYQRPLHIVRGQGQYLFDSSDLTYLDCVNNVAHVGHCHPKVVAAARNQIGQLNTNTRYLHENIVRLAAKLTAKLPDPLQICFFVNSGSEANDLALRLARIYTNKTDVVVIDHAYHGTLSSLIEISPYKFNRSGGAGKPEHVHVVPLPNGYRGLYSYNAPEWGARYASAARSIIEAAISDGRPIGTFIAESLLGCGGQVPLPDGYLAAIYPLIRKLGGVCIADEVQVGFGRTGSHFWGFQSQEVVPDIVTMGKPMGNGHPLAAVVTTREIADAFNNGMEYFNTFGGNPVSCAIGEAVLDVLEKQELQQHAEETGRWLMGQFNQLAQKHSVIGDVRGRGLFLGIELVSDPSTREPAADLANCVVNTMRDHCILLSTEGPHNNVLKIKPPMVFDRADAERLVRVLDRVLSQQV